jgi:ABC-type transport system involved in multi-copper enzyme maturation permease subunit
MFGPVLYLEMLLGGRRGRQMIFRYLYGGWLILQFAFLWFVYWSDYQTRTRLAAGLMPPDPNATSRFATGFVEMFILQQLILTVLITPAFSAGAITDEKTRGTLQYMLTAHLTAGEIIIGKLLGRMAQVGLLILAGLPVLCFVGVFGGLHPAMMIAVFVVTVAPVFALAAASLLASVWCRQTRDAVLSLYAVGAGALVAFAFIQYLATSLSAGVAAGNSPGPFLSLLMGINGVVSFFNPLYVLEPGWETGQMVQVARRLVGSIVAWGGVGAACLGLAVWRLRGSYIRQLENSGKKPSANGEAARRSEIADEPIRWKEREVDGIAPLAVLHHIPSALGLALVFFLTAISSLGLLWASLPSTLTWAEANSMIWRGDVLALISSISGPTAGPKFLWQAITAMLIASLIVGIRASGTVSGERERQTWEALLLTPLESKQLIRGKLWGIFGAALRALVAYALPALFFSVLGGFQAFFWTVLWLAVTLLAMWYIGAAGICCSVRSRTSWRALLGTLGFGYVGGFVAYACTTPIVLIVALIILLFLQLVDQFYNLGFVSSTGASGDYFIAAFFIATCLGLAAMFYGLAWWFISDAEKRVADRERTRHWKDEPLYRPRRRPVTLAQARYN